MQGRIRRVVQQRVEPRGDARLPSAWIRVGQPATVTLAGPWLNRGAAVSSRPNAGPVLVLLGAGAADVRAMLQAHGAAGARVYALVGPDWGKERADADLAHAPRVLVRRVQEVPATGIHSDSGAHLWLGGGAVLRLDDRQAEALRQTFLRLFWHEATEEAWSGGRQFLWRPARERPFDVPELPASAPVRLEGPDARLSGALRGALVHLTAGTPPEVTPERLWCPAGPEHHAQLSRLVRDGVEISWEERGLPDLLVSGASGEALLPGGRGRLRIQLTPTQAEEVGRLLRAGGSWRFQTEVRIGDPALRQASFWLAGEASARGLEAEQRIELPDVLASSLRAVTDASPESVPASQPLALAVRYQWTVVPPRPPGGATEDALVGRWRKLDQDWEARLTRVREALAAAEGDRGRIGRAFSRLMSALLGFERTQRGLQARVGELEARRPSVVGPDGAPALLDQLAEVEAQARKLQDDMADAERKAREDEEREKQRAAWQAGVDTAKREGDKRRSALSDAEEQRASIVAALGTAEEDLKSADAAARKDLQARQRKLSDELQRANKGIARLRGEITALEQQAAAPFEFRPSASASGRTSQPGGRFIPPSPGAKASSQVPDEALPEVGALRSKQGQRYLVIENWEELTVGGQAAARLSATLVAPEDV